MGKLPIESLRFAGTSASFDPPFLLPEPKFPVNPPEVRNAGLVFERFVSVTLLFKMKSEVIKFSENSKNGLVVGLEQVGLVSSSLHNYNYTKRGPVRVPLCHFVDCLPSVCVSLNNWTGVLNWYVSFSLS